MATGSFSEDFKRDAVAQITERGYPAQQRLDLTRHWSKRAVSQARGYTSDALHQP